MRIALVDPASWVLPYDYFYVRELVHRGYTVDFYCSRTQYNADFLDSLRALGVVVRTYDISRSVASRWKALPEYWRMLSDVTCQSYRWVHFQFGIAILLELPFALILRRRLIITIHDDIPHGSRKSIHMPTLLLCSVARRIVFVSPFTLRRFCANYPARLHDKVVLMQIGLMPISDVASTVSTSSELPERTVIFFGTVKPYKGIGIFDGLVDILKEDQFRLEIHGKWDPSLLYQKDSLAAKGVHIYDRYLPRDEIDVLLNRSAIFILPYVGGSQSAVFYSLLAHGRVMVASLACDSGVVLSEINDHQLTFTPGDAASAAQAIRRGLRDYASIAKRLREIAVRYRWDAVMANVATLYES